MPYTNKLQFDVTRAQRYKPFATTKFARLVTVPDGQKTSIVPQWGGSQDFVGSYFEILNSDTGAIMYGSAAVEWLAMHEPVDGVENGWVKTAYVDAYPSDVAGVFDTVLADGTIEVKDAPVEVGDYLVRQMLGEEQRISRDTFPTLYDVNSASPIPLRSSTFS